MNAFGREQVDELAENQVFLLGDYGEHICIDMPVYDYTYFIKNGFHQQKHDFLVVEVARRSNFLAHYGKIVKCKLHFLLIHVDNRVRARVHHQRPQTASRHYRLFKLHIRQSKEQPVEIVVENNVINRQVWRKYHNVVRHSGVCRAAERETYLSCRAYYSRNHGGAYGPCEKNVTETILYKDVAIVVVNVAVHNAKI